MPSTLATPLRIKRKRHRWRRVASSKCYPGQYFDAESGLHQNGFRDYEPGGGRYIESDPIGIFGDIATYLYASGDPIRYMDLRGLKPVQGCNGNNGEVTCDGNGGFEIRNCNRGCTRQCTQRHEEQHVADLMRIAPNKCRGKARGSLYEEHDAYALLPNKLECAGARVSIKCADEIINEEYSCTSPDCKREAERYKISHENELITYGCARYGF